MDLRLPDGTGVESCREIRAICPGTRVLFLTSYQEDEAVLAATFAGASGYLLKQIDHVALTMAVEAVANGQSVVDPQMTAAVLDRMRTLSTSSEKGAPVTLSPQQKRVLALLAEGKTNKEIAAELAMGVRTVEQHRLNMTEKLDLRGRHALAKLAAEFKDAAIARGLLPPGGTTAPAEVTPLLP